MIGFVGYDCRQITGDSGSGDKIGSFMGSVDAVGAGLSYSTVNAKTRYRDCLDKYGRASCDMLLRSARCTKCGRKSAAQPLAAAAIFSYACAGPQIRMLHPHAHQLALALHLEEEKLET